MQAKNITITSKFPCDDPDVPSRQIIGLEQIGENEYVVYLEFKDPVEALIQDSENILDLSDQLLASHRMTSAEIARKLMQ